MITLAQLQGCTLRESAHLNGGSAWFGYMYECNEHPRLQRRIRYYRKDRSHDVTWYVDGVEIGGQLQDALPALNKPPVLTADEQAVYDKVTADYVDRRRELDIPTLLMLRNKGLIEFEDGKCRRRGAL